MAPPSRVCDENGCGGRMNTLNQGQILKPGTGKPCSFRCDVKKSDCHVLKEGESLVMNALPTYVPPGIGDACRCPGPCASPNGCKQGCDTDGGDASQGFTKTAEGSASIMATRNRNVNINNAPNLEFDFENPPLQSLTDFARKPETELPFDILLIDYVDDAYLDTKHMAKVYCKFLQGMHEMVKTCYRAPVNNSLKRSLQGLVGVGDTKHKVFYPEHELGRHFKKYARHTNIEGSPLEESLQEIGESFGLQGTLKEALETDLNNKFLLPLKNFLDRDWSEVMAHDDMVQQLAKKIQKAKSDNKTKEQIGELKELFAEERAKTINLFQFIITSEYSQIMKLTEMTQCFLEYHREGYQMYDTLLKSLHAKLTAIKPSRHKRLIPVLGRNSNGATHHRCQCPTDQMLFLPASGGGMTTVGGMATDQRNSSQTFSHTGSRLKTGKSKKPKKTTINVNNNGELIKESTNNNGELKDACASNNGHQTNKHLISECLNGCVRTVGNTEIAYRVKCNDVVLGFNPRNECAKYGIGNVSCNNCNAVTTYSQDSAVQTVESAENVGRICEQTGARDCGQIVGHLGLGLQNGDSTLRRNDPMLNTTRMDVIEEEEEESEKERFENMVEAFPLEKKEQVGEGMGKRGDDEEVTEGESTAMEEEKKEEAVVEKEEEKKEEAVVEKEEEKKRQIEETDSESDNVLSGKDEYQERTSERSLVELSDSIGSGNTLEEHSVERMATNVVAITEDDNAYIADDSLSNGDDDETVDEADPCDAIIETHVSVSNEAVDEPGFCETMTHRQESILWKDDRQDSDFSDDYHQHEAKFRNDYQYDLTIGNQNDTFEREEGNCTLMGKAAIHSDRSVKSNYNNGGFDNNVQRYEDTSGVTFTPTFSVSPGHESNSFLEGNDRHTDRLQSLREETSNSVAAATANAAIRPRRGCNVPNFFEDPRGKIGAASSSSPSPLLPSSIPSSTPSPSSRLSQGRQEPDAESRVNQKGIQMKSQREAAKPEEEARAQSSSDLKIQHHRAESRDSTSKEAKETESTKTSRQIGGNTGDNAVRSRGRCERLRDSRERSSGSRERSSDSHRRSSDSRKRPSDSHQRSSDSHQKSSDSDQRSSHSRQRSSDSRQRSSDSRQRSRESQETNRDDKSSRRSRDLSGEGQALQNHGSSRDDQAKTEQLPHGSSERSSVKHAFNCDKQTHGIKSVRSRGRSSDNQAQNCSRDQSSNESDRMSCNNYAKTGDEKSRRGQTCNNQAGDDDERSSRDQSHDGCRGRSCDSQSHEIPSHDGLRGRLHKSQSHGGSRERSRNSQSRVRDKQSSKERAPRTFLTVPSKKLKPPSIKIDPPPEEAGMLMGSSVSSSRRHSATPRRRPYGFLSRHVSGTPLSVGDIVYLRRRYRDSFLVIDDAGRNAVVPIGAVDVILDRKEGEEED